MQAELRILTGLHRGATLPLEDATLLLGADEEADVVLVDPGIIAHHASLSPSGQGWLLSAGDGPVYGVDTAAPQTLVDLDTGSFFRIADTWLVISEQGQPWQTAPPMPRDDDLDAQRSMQDDGSSAVFESASPESLAAPETIDDAAPALATGPAPARARSRRAWLVAPAALLVVLFGVAAYAYSSRPSQPSLQAPMLDTAPRPLTLTYAMAAAVVAPAPVEKSQIALQAAFRKRMKEADLLQHFDLDLNDTGWSMRAHLDDAEGARFERILKTFVSDNKITFPVSARVGSAESMLPFKIRQVVSGVNAGIVTADGERFYVGDELNGVRLVAVTDNHLTFMGKRKIEVIW